MASYVADNVSIHPRAEIEEDVEIGPFCVVGPNVHIGRGTRLALIQQSPAGKVPRPAHAAMTGK